MVCPGSDVTFCRWLFSALVHLRRFGLIQTAPTGNIVVQSEIYRE